LNEGNKALQNELNATKLPAAVVKKQFEIGVVLVGMAMIHDDKQRKPKKAASDGEQSENGKPEDSLVLAQASQFTRAIAPVILPMIQSLGDLADEEADLSEPRRTGGGRVGAALRWRRTTFLLPGVSPRWSLYQRRPGTLRHSRPSA
jgi:hypothetical protein